MKTGTNVNEQFIAVFKGYNNIMTPDIIYRKIIGNHGVELSSGEGMMGSGDIFGVTVLSDIHSDEPKRESGLNGCFESREAAEAHIALIESNPQPDDSV